MTELKTTDVLIIGAGWTGLSAAMELNRLKADFQLLDQFDDHLGGRALSFAVTGQDGNTYHFDHGAQYVGDRQNEIMGLIRELIPQDLVNGAHDRLPYQQEVMLLDQKRYSYPKDDSLFGIGGLPPSIGLWDVLGMLILLQEITGIEAMINVAEPWNSPKAIQALDQLTMQQWLSRDWITPTAHDLINISVQALLSVQPEEISPFYLFWYTACNDGFLNEVNDNQGGPQQYWLSSGVDKLAERWSEPIKDRITQGVRVTQIDTHQDGLVKVLTDDGTTWKAKRVIVAMSPNTAGKMKYVPDIEPQRRLLFEQNMGKTIKCQVFYKTKWWHDSFQLQYDGYVGGADFPVLWVMDNSPPEPANNSCNVLMTFTIGDYVDQLGPDPSHADITKLVTEGLAYLMNDLRALSTSDEFLELKSYDWSPSNPYIQGGPNTIFAPKMMTGPEAPARLLNAPFNERVFFAAAETSMKLDPLTDSPYYDIKRDAVEPQYDDQANLIPPAKPTEYVTKYSDWRASLGYMDGGITAGAYVANQVAKSIGMTNYNRGVDRPVPQMSPPAAAAMADPPTPKEISVVEMVEMLSALGQGIYDASDLDVPKWTATDWATDAQALQNWLSELIVGVLVQFGVITNPHNPADLLLGMQTFTNYGYKYYSTDTTGMPLPEAEKYQDVVEMTKVVNALMQVKSTEPFSPETVGMAKLMPATTPHKHAARFRRASVTDRSGGPRSAPGRLLHNLFQHLKR